MRKITLESVKGSSIIYQNGEYVVILGAFLWIFRTDGTFVAKKQNIRWPRKVAFLPDNRAVVEGSKNYHYVSLEDGADLWQYPCPKADMIPPLWFAVSPDDNIVYDCYCGKNGKLYVVQLNLGEQVSSSFEVPQNMRLLRHLFCDKNGALFGLESQASEDNICQLGIRNIFPSMKREDIVWQYLWTQEMRGSALYTDGKYVLNKDLTVLKLETMERFDLFENRGDWNLTEGIYHWDYDSERSYLIVCNTSVYENVVIDCKAHQMIARYSGYAVEDRYVGCLVGDEFWIGTPDGIVRKPFPLIEEMPEYEPPEAAYWRWVRQQQMLRCPENKDNKK